MSSIFGSIYLCEHHDNCVFSWRKKAFFFNHKSKNGKQYLRSEVVSICLDGSNCNWQWVPKIPQEFGFLFYSWCASFLRQLLTNVSAARKQWHELAGCTARGSCLWEDRTSKIARKRCCSFFPLNWMSYLSSMYGPWRLTGNMFLLAEDGVTNIPKYYFLPTYEICLKILIPSQRMKMHKFSVHRTV